jgi:phage gpG-like protein
MVVLKAAADRIDSGGPGWAPNITGTPLLHQTGRLLSSLSIGAAGNVDDITQNTISVGTNVAYAAWLQIGTGIFGPKGERITPKSANALAFPIGGKMMFFSSIAGAPPRRFLYVDQAVADQVRTVFARYILEGQAGS